MAFGRNKKSYSVKQKSDKYRKDIKGGRKSKANTFRKGYVTALNDINKEYKVTKK